MIIGFAFYALVMIAMCGILASTKHRDVWGWSALGLFFGIFAFLLLWALPVGPDSKAETISELSSKLDKRAIILVAILFLFIFALNDFSLWSSSEN